MKNNIGKIFGCLLVSLCAVSATVSCEIDTYDAPDAMIYGTVYDNEGNPLQTEQGSGGMVIRLLENGYENPDPFDLNMKQDGTYINHKVFAASYMAFPFGGPFYPVSAVEVEVKDRTRLDFTVTPYLKVEWVETPEVLADGRISASFSFTRMAPPQGSSETMPDLLDCQLFISHTQYVGNNNYDNLVVDAAVSVSNNQEGSEITLVSKTPMKFSRDYFVRIGVRVNDANQKYNYTDIHKVTVKLQ